MGHNVQAMCAECAQKCGFFHGKRGSSSHVPTSFFKIMLGDKFSQVLYIPPKFRRTMSALKGNKVILKDSSGEKWQVKLSFINGSLALKEGWDVFSSDHGLKVGDFLLFNYSNELHFDVLVFDKSGCERLDLSRKGNQKKRGRSRSGSPVRDGMIIREGSNASVILKPDGPEMKSQQREVNSSGTKNNIENNLKYDSNNNGRAQSGCIAELYEDPCYITSRDFGGKETDEKTSMFDVLDCEILNNCDVDGTRKITTGDSKDSHVDNGSRVYQNDVYAIEYYKDPLFERILSRGAASDPCKVELSGRNSSLRESDKSAYDKTSILNLEENQEKNSMMSNREGQDCQSGDDLESYQMVISNKEPALPIGSFQKVFNGILNISDAIHNGEMPRGVKKEPVDVSLIAKDEFQATDEMCKRIKMEDMTPNGYNDELLIKGLSEAKGAWGQNSHLFNEDNENHFQIAATVSCVVPNDTDHFLELPAPLPLPHKRRVKMERMVVYLRDRLRRLWPVVYHDRMNLKILTDGWLEFRRANNIQPLDVCIFGVENQSKGIFAVDIVQK